MTSITWKTVAVSPVMAALFIIAAAPITARDGLPWEPETPSQVSGDYRALDVSDFDQPPDSSLDGVRTVFNTGYQWQNGLMSAIGHSYDGMDFELPANMVPPTNGDVHTLHLTTGWHGPWAGGTLSLALAPAISASSNAFNTPEEWSSEMLQVWGSVLYTHPFGEEGNGINWVAGLAHDYRFGEDRVYPLLGLRWTGARTRLQLVYPDLLLEQDFGSGWTVAFSTSPDGNRWRVYDSDHQNSEDLVREGWLSELRLHKRWQRLDIAISAGYQWHQRWIYRTAGGAETALSSDDTPTLGLHFRWLLGSPQ